MNLADLIAALKQAERTAETLWPNAETYVVKCFGEHGVIRRITVEDGDTETHTTLHIDIEV